MPSLGNVARMWGAPAPHPPDRGWPPLVSPLKNDNMWASLGDHAQRVYRTFVVSTYGLQKDYKTSFGNALIDGGQGLAKRHTAYDYIYLGSRGNARVPFGRRGFRGQGGPLTPPA